ncbi:MAG: hypothetical protein JKY33_01875 [Bacteroidia bacterium]|nr:hypothetical protein [Bacteroidia bacterium]
MNPVKWKFATEKKTDKELELQFKVLIAEHWKVYGQDLDEGGPIPTTFYFKPSSKYELVGEFTPDEAGYVFGVIEEPEGTQFYDQIFEMKLKTFSDEAIFRQKIKVRTKDEFKIEGYLHFMCCDENMCLPPAEIEFEFLVSINGG